MVMRWGCGRLACLPPMLSLRPPDSQYAHRSFGLPELLMIPQLVACSHSVAWTMS